MAYIRQDVHGTSGQDILKINENFMNIFEKVFGDINFSDVDSELQKRINKQWIPVQGEGNLDSSNPLKIRFFIPPNTTKLVSTNFNVITENYRMDSSITSTQESKQEVIAVASSFEPQQTKTASSETVAVSSVSSETVGVTSVSDTTVGITSVAGGGQTSDDGGGYVKYVRKWGGANGSEYTHPTDPLDPSSNVVWLNGGYVYTSGRDDMGALIKKVYYTGIEHHAVDFQQWQHSHEIPAHGHWVKGHSHDITLKPHTHTVSLKAHAHDITMKAHSHEVVIPGHDHTINASVTIPEHSHKLNEGVKISSTNPSNVKFKINGTEFCTLNGNDAKNNIDITENVKIGEWNVIEISASTVARAVVYGTVELIAI